MSIINKVFYFSKFSPNGILISLHNNLWRRFYGIAFVDFYKTTTGESISDSQFKKMKKRHPGIDKLSHEQLQHTLQILQKFGITAVDACLEPHVFTMDPITMDNYGEILTECAFTKILPKYIIRYHTIVKSRTIAKLKKENLLRMDLNLQEVLIKHLEDWIPQENLPYYPDSETNIVTVRMDILKMYLNWKLGITSEEFAKYLRTYLPFRHKPFSDIQEAIALAQNEINFDVPAIRRNGFLISTDPVKTKLILKNVKCIGGLDIREAIRKEPGILKNNYKALQDVHSLLEQYEISDEAQRKCLRVYCMKPESVKERLDELRNLKEYRVLKTNPRALTMVVHKRKIMDRLEKIQEAKKQCFSLNHLISASEVFNNYINSFGNKVCGRDLAILISSSLLIHSSDSPTTSNPDMKLVLQKLKRHKFWLHAALSVIDENIQLLKRRFDDDVIFNNCQLLLYPAIEIENYIDHLSNLRSGGNRKLSNNIKLDVSYNNLEYSSLNDNQILSLVLYEIEKKYHFSGDGIWSKQEAIRIEQNG